MREPTIGGFAQALQRSIVERPCDEGAHHGDRGVDIGKPA